MCRNIKTLFNFEPPATEHEIRDAALQFVRKLRASPSVEGQRGRVRAGRGRRSPARAALIGSLVTNAEPRDRDDRGRSAPARELRFDLGTPDAHFSRSR